jgi:hypothetical protein
MTFSTQHLRQPPRAQKRPSREQLVDATLYANMVVIGWPRRPVHSRARDPQQMALSTNR